MDQAKKRIEELGYDVLGLKEVRYVKAGISNASICTECSAGCMDRCSTCKDCTKGKKN